MPHDTDPSPPNPDPNPQPANNPEHTPKRPQSDPSFGEINLDDEAAAEPVRPVGDWGEVAGQPGSGPAPAEPPASETFSFDDPVPGADRAAGPLSPPGFDIPGAAPAPLSEVHLPAEGPRSSTELSEAPPANLEPIAPVAPASGWLETGSMTSLGQEPGPESAPPAEVAGSSDIFGGSAPPAEPAGHSDVLAATAHPPGSGSDLRSAGRPVMPGSDVAL